MTSDISAGPRVSTFAGVSVVIPTHNHRDDTLACLDSLFASRYAQLRVFLVDNGSTDDTVPTIRASYPDVDVTALGTNQGFARATNTGIRRALQTDDRYVLLMNNDAVVAPKMIRELVGVGEAHGGECVLSPRILYHGTERIWSMGSRMNSLTFDLVDYGTGRVCGLPMDRTSPIDVVLGCGMFVGRRVFDRIGLLDERFFFYYEDMDFSLRAGEAGIPLLAVPSATMWHKVSLSTEGSTYLREFYRARGSVLFYRKHTQGLQRLFMAGYRTLSALRATVRLLLRDGVRPVSGYWRGIAAGLAGHVTD